jgi:DNA-binding transcriptional MerR regulator
MTRRLRLYRVGELARLTGVSVRTLHHYDAIGLLCPSLRGENGYRWYSGDDVARLQQIKSLRSLGFSLEDVRSSLERHLFLPEHIIAMHLERLRERIALEQKLCARLEAVQQCMSTRQNISAEEWLTIIEAITMTEKYYTPEQMEYLARRREKVGEERIREVEAEWPRLMDEVRQAVERGDDPASAGSQELARRWNGLVEEFTGGNDGIRQSLNSMYQNETHVAGMDVQAMQPLYDFIQRASEARQNY